MNTGVVPTSADRTEFNRKASKLRLAQLKNTTLSAPKVGISFADKLKYLRQSYQIAQQRSEEVINTSENSALKGHEQAILKVYGALSTLLFASICGSSTTIEELETFIRKSVSQIPTAEFDFYGEWQLVLNVARECRQQGSKTQAALPIYQRKMKLFQYAANNSVKLMKNELILLKNDVLQSLQDMNQEMFETFSHIQAITPSVSASGNGQRLPEIVVQKIVETPKPAVIKSHKSVQTDAPPTPKVAPVTIPTTPVVVTAAATTPTHGKPSSKMDDVVLQCNQRLESVMQLVNGCLTNNDDSEERERLQARIDELQSRLVTVDRLIEEMETANAEQQREALTSLKTLQDTPLSEPVVMVVEGPPRKRSSSDLLQAQQSLRDLISSYERRYQQQWSHIESTLKSTEARLTKVQQKWKGVSYEKLTANIMASKLVSDSQIESLVKEINAVYANKQPTAAPTGEITKQQQQQQPPQSVSRANSAAAAGRPLSGKTLTDPENVVKVQSIIRGFLGRVRVKKIHTIIAASEQGVLVAYSGTKQGETGWYIAQDQLFYFICHNGEFLLMCGPVSKDMYDLAREELNASPRFALNPVKERLPINLTVDRHGLHATRIQIETLLDDLKTRDALIEQLYSDIAYLQEVANNAQNSKMTHQHETVLLRRQVLECQGMVEMLTKEKHRLQNKDTVDVFQRRLRELVDNAQRLNMSAFVKLSSIVRGFNSRNRVKKMKLFRLAHETGVLVAMKNTVQGDSGWYVGPNGTIFYFVLKNGEWIHTAGPIYEKDFQFMRQITKLRVPLIDGEILSRCPFRLAESHAEMFEQGDLFVSNRNDKLYLALPIDLLMPSIQEPMELSVSAVSSISKPDDTVDNMDNGSLADSLE